MVSRAYGKAFTEEEIRDVYSAAWTATLSALRVRGATMSDDELRSYVLTAVASHASKEMRRRTRKPAGSLDDAKEGVIADCERLLPEERAIGNEAGGIARDLLSSLPPRRRAVMLLRYGWGLSPEEVCGLVQGLSPRAYRKEVTRGVAELIERLELIESGEWCKSREPMLREFIAGTATEEERLQVTEHLRHCRGCSSLAAKLRSHLHELGAAGALTAVSDLSGRFWWLPDRLLAGWHGLRETITDKADQAAIVIGNLAPSGGMRGTGVAGAGVVAKLAGAGGTGKAALACLGVTAAAGACVATGVLPSIPIKGVLPEVSRDREAGRAQPPNARLGTITQADAQARTEPAPELNAPGQPQQEEDPHPPPTPQEPPAASPAPVPAPVPVSPAQEEFDPIAAAPTAAPAAPPPSSSAGSAGSGGSAAVAAEEFGP